MCSLSFDGDVVCGGIYGIYDVSYEKFVYVDVVVLRGGMFYGF